MAEDLTKWTLQPAYKLIVAIVVGLMMSVMALAWPALVRGDSPPVITGVEVTSSKGTFFYSPPLADTGGAVYFNNLSGEGADQIITVTVAISDGDVATFEGGYAFGIAPTTSISNADGTWSVTYTAHAADPSQNGVVFTVTDSGGFTDTLVITFTRDTTDPTVNSPDIIENSPYLYAVGTGIYYGDDMPTAVPFTVTGNASDGSGVGLDRATFSTALDDTPPDDPDPGTWIGVYTADSTNTTGAGAITVTVYDKVGNNITHTFAYTRDTQGPDIVPDFVKLTDADSGNDGFAPSTDWEDDLIADFTWGGTTDNPGGSGVAGYLLSSSSPVTTAFYTTTTGSLTMSADGAYTLTIQAQDRVGNLSDASSVGPATFDREPPINGLLDLYEVSGGEYLYIADYDDITTGALFYNNLSASSFRVTADNTDPSFEWGGDYSEPWKVAFSPGWGESSMSEDFFSPFRHTYNIAPSETTDVFTTYYVNKAGNVLSIPINAELDTTGPSITFTSVTTPDWDADGDTSDYANYWYRISELTGGWDFTTDVVSEQAGVDPGVGRAYWDHTIDTYDQDQAAAGGDGAFAGVSGNADGLVTVTVVLTDQVNNAGSVSMTLNLDSTPPVITPAGWSETSDYLHVIGDELFFSHIMPADQEAILNGTAADNAGGSSLDRAAFSGEPNLAGSPADDTTPVDWSGVYTFASGSTQGDGLAVVTVYDHVGNNVTASFTYTEDAAPPSVTISNVTNPGYDPDGDPLNDVGNWYASDDFDDGPNGDGWEFYFGFGDSQAGVRSATADWDHSADAYDQMGYDPGNPVDGQGVFGSGTSSSGAAVNDDADGVVTVTVRLEDNVGNVSSDSLTLRIDNTPPAITNGGWSESSEFLHADGSTLYFGHQMAGPQQATLSGYANDGGGSGLDTMSFSNESNLAGSPDPDGTPADWAGNYTFDSSSSQGDGTAVVTFTDYLAHVATQTYNYVLDTTPPTTPGNFSIDTSPAQPDYYDTQTLSLSWDSSSDDQSQLQGYYLGDSNPPPSFYPPGTTNTTFDVGGDGTFTLYLMVRDNVGNTSLTSTGLFTIDTQAPAPWVQTTPDSSQNRILVEWGANDPVPGTWPVDYDIQYRITATGSWQTWFTNTPITSAYFGPDTPVSLELETPYYFRVRARDYVSNESGWSPEASGGVGLKETFLPLVISNFDPSIPFAVFDGFETGAFVGWKTGGALPYKIVTSPLPPGGGSYTARLGSPGYGCGNIPVGQAYMKAYANVPAGGTPYLRFDYRVFSYDTVRTSTGKWWDRLEVQVNGTALARYGDPDPENLSCSNLYDSGWQQGEFDLSTYAGQTILLTFFNENHGDGWYNTYSYLDNIRIEVD